MMPKLDRRSFVIGSRRSRVRRSASTSLRRALGSAQAAPEVNAWVVIKPDDTVVIRIARSEMGQGTLTGLAQLVAEELECDWSKVDDRISDARPEPRAQSRLGQFLAPAAAAASATSHDYVRKGGAAARMMLIQAAANEWKVPAVRMQRRQERDHAHGVGPHAPPTARSPPRPPSSSRRRRSRSRIRRTGRSPASRVQAARHRRQGQRQADLRHRRQAAGHAERRDQGLPGLRRQGEELRRRQGRGHAGRQEGRPGRR